MKQVTLLTCIVLGRGPNEGARCSGFRQSGVQLKVSAELRWLFLINHDEIKEQRITISDVGRNVFTTALKQEKKGYGWGSPPPRPD